MVGTGRQNQDVNRENQSGQRKSSPIEGRITLGGNVRPTVLVAALTASPIILVGLALLAMSLGLGAIAYALYSGGQPGNPRPESWSPARLDRIVFILPEGIKGFWDANFAIDDKFSKVEYSYIALRLEAPSPRPVAQTDISVYFEEVSRVSRVDVFAWKPDPPYLGLNQALNVNAETLPVQFRDRAVDQVLTFNVPPDKWLPKTSGLAVADISVDFTFLIQPMAREGSRVAISLPQVESPAVCSHVSTPPAADIDLSDLVEIDNKTCTVAQGSSSNRYKLLATPRPIRFDFVRPQPELDDIPYRWTSARAIGVRMNIALIDEEARSQRNLFLSGVLAGIAAAFLPLGLDIFIKAAMSRNRKSQQRHPSSAS